MSTLEDRERDAFLDRIEEDQRLRALLEEGLGEEDLEDEEYEEDE